MMLPPRQVRHLSKKIMFLSYGFNSVHVSEYLVQLLRCALPVVWAC